MMERRIAIRMLVWGIALAVLEIFFLAGLLAASTGTGLRVLSMIGAGHLGGRLAFIGAGFEAGFSALTITGIVTFHNCTMLLLIYPVWLLLSQRLENNRFFAGLREKVRLGRSLRTRWNLLGIAMFTWMPLPMTGTVAGALLAYFEGYGPKQMLPVALAAMMGGWSVGHSPSSSFTPGCGASVQT